MASIHYAFCSSWKTSWGINDSDSGGNHTTLAVFTHKLQLWTCLEKSSCLGSWICFLETQGHNVTIRKAILPSRTGFNQFSKPESQLQFYEMKKCKYPEVERLSPIWLHTSKQKPDYGSITFHLLIKGFFFFFNQSLLKGWSMINNGVLSPYSKSLVLQKPQGPHFSLLNKLRFTQSKNKTKCNWSLKPSETKGRA